MWPRGRVPVPEDPAGPLGAPKLAVERFAWVAPDRLLVAGTFTGLGPDGAESPVLVLRGARTHRLPAVVDDAAGPPRDGRTWSATFAWREPPEAFDTAALEVGDVVVELPSMRERDGQAAAAGPDRTGVAARVAVDPLERLRLETDLFGARDEARSVREALDEARIALARAQEDLEHERELRAADAKRFRDSLASVRASADALLAERDDVAARLEAELDEAHRAVSACESLADGLRSEVAEARREAEVERAAADRLRGALTRVRELVER